MQHDDRSTQDPLLQLSSAPSPQTGSALPREGDSRTWILNTMRRNAPILSFHPDEKYFPYNVPDYLKNVQLCDARGKVLAQPPLTSQNLPTGAGSAATYLSIPDDRSWIEAGDLRATRIYCHALRWNHGAFTGADFQYFFFYPYNGKGFINIRFPGLPNNDIEIPAGAHQGDWESIIVRTDDNGNVLGIYCNQHGSGQWYLPTQLQWRGSHPVIYVARSGHPSFDAVGHYPTAGGDFTVGIPGFRVGVQLDNPTGAGFQFPTAEVVDLIAASYFDGAHVEEPWWLNYLGRFGLVVFNERDKEDTTRLISQDLAKVMPEAAARYLAEKITPAIFRLLGEIEPDGPEPPKAKGWWNTIRTDGPWYNVSRCWSGNRKISSLPGHINPLTRDNIALASYGDKLCMAFRSQSSDELFQAWYDGSTWSGNTPIRISDGTTALSTHGPALASYDGKLYAAFKASSSNDLYYAWYDGTSWHGNVRVETDRGVASSTAAPALQAFQGRLIMTFKAADASNMVYMCSFDGERWTGNRPIETDHGTPLSPQSPALATYNGALHMTFVGQGQSMLYMCSFDGERWTGNQSIDTIDHGTAWSSLAPWMTSLDGELIMLFKGADSDYVYLAKLLASAWYGNQRLSRTTPISPLTSASGGIARLGDRLITVFKAADSNEVYQAECAISC